MNLTEQPPIVFHHYFGGDGTTVAAHIALNSVGANELRILLSRALNTIPPHDPQWKDWFDLSDALDKAAGNSATVG